MLCYTGLGQKLRSDFKVLGPIINLKFWREHGNGFPSIGKDGVPTVLQHRNERLFLHSAATTHHVDACTDSS